MNSVRFTGASGRRTCRNLSTIVGSRFELWDVTQVKAKITSITRVIRQQEFGVGHWLETVCLLMVFIFFRARDNRGHQCRMYFDPQLGFFMES